MYQIGSLTREEYALLIETLKESRESTDKCKCHCNQKVIYLPCGLNHYPTYPTLNINPWIYPTVTTNGTISTYANPDTFHTGGTPGVAYR